MDDYFYVDCKPGSDSDINLFDLKKTFMYAVFTKTFLTDKGKSLARKHERDYNAHDIHIELLAYMLR